MAVSFVVCQLPMKIIYIANNWIDDGSSAIYATYNVWGMARNHMETHLIVRNVSKGDTSSLMETYFGLDVPENLTIHRIEKRLKKANFEYYWKASKLVGALSDENTVVISRTPKIFPFLLRSKNRKYRIFYETHNFFHDLDRRDDLSRKNFSLRKTALQEKMTLKKIDGLICLTNTLKQLWQEYVTLPVHVIYPGLLPPRQPKRDHQTINLAYTGSLDQGRGIYQILEMAAQLPDNYKVYLFGGKKDREIEHLNQLIAKNHLENTVEVTGWLSQRELQKRLSNMHLGLLPLRDNFFNRYLTAPSKFFDYLAHSLPAVASSLPALDELVVQNNLGITVDWDQPHAVAREIVRLMADAPKYNILSNSVYRFAREHTWEKRGEKIRHALFDQA